jgi:hypothetical protein
MHVPAVKTRAWALWWGVRRRGPLELERGASKFAGARIDSYKVNIANIANISAIKYFKYLEYLEYVQHESSNHHN